LVTKEEVTISKTTLPNWRAAAFILERRHPDRWTKKIRTEVSGPDGGPVKTEDTTFDDPKRAKKVAELFDRARQRAAEADGNGDTESNSD
jgi:hypothetical protein